MQYPRCKPFKLLALDATLLLQAGLFMGRFQPFHLGHLSAVKFALSRARELIIAIGSAQKSYDSRNPFTTGERLSMINASLKREADIDLESISIIPVPDLEIHKLWTASVRTLAPRFDIVFSNDAFTSALFKAEGVTVEAPPLFRRAEISGTDIRALLGRGDSKWRSLVPESVCHFIDSIGAADRLKILADVESHRTMH